MLALGSARKALQKRWRRIMACVEYNIVSIPACERGMRNELFSGKVVSIATVQEYLGNYST